MTQWPKEHAVEEHVVEEHAVEEHAVEWFAINSAELLGRFMVSYTYILS